MATSKFLQYVPEYDSYKFLRDEVAKATRGLAYDTFEGHRVVNRGSFPIPAKVARALIDDKDLQLRQPNSREWVVIDMSGKQKATADRAYEFAVSDLLRKSSEDRARLDKVENDNRSQGEQIKTLQTAVELLKCPTSTLVRLN